MVTLAGDGGIDLDVLLPDTPGRTPTAELFAALHRSAAPRETALTLPRVQARTAEELSPYLDAAGAGTLFTGDADLSGLSPAPLRVDAILHQAVLAVDEAGAEGAAATAAIAYMGMPPPSLPFTVDRPFTAVLRRGPDLLFLAHVADPGGAAER
jgi:serpin B